MDDKNEKDPKKPLPPPFPGDIMRHGVPIPPAPPARGGGGPGLPPMPGGGPALPRPAMPSFQQAPAARPDRSEEELRAAREEKEKLEKRMLEMEKVVAQEKEKALLATLKSQQDEVLSSKVESSLKDIQDKLRRERRDQEVEEERLTLKSKVKELENRIVQERETWMQTLKGQMLERETQSKDVEGHFIFRLQEMERRWLEEKAQWQRTIGQKEDEVRSLKNSSERLTEVQQELRESGMERTLLERESGKLREEISRLERERAAVEGYIKSIPDKERELAQLRAEVAILKMKEEKSSSEYKSREDKLNADIDRLQRDIGSIADRKNSEKEQELAKARDKHEAELHSLEAKLAEASGEKVRAISELVKLKGFISRVQAVNAALEKERSQMRVEKVQLAQGMAAGMEETKRLKSELENFAARHAGEIEALAAAHAAELEKIRRDLAGEITRDYEEKLALARKAAQEEVSRLQRRYDAETANLQKAHQQDLERVSSEKQIQAESRAMELRGTYEAAMADMKANLKARMEADYSEELRKLKDARNRADEEGATLRAETQRLAAELRAREADLQASSAASRGEKDRFEAAMKERLAMLGEEKVRIEGAMKAQAAAAEAAEAARRRMEAELEALKVRSTDLARQAAELSGNAAEREKELAALKDSFRIENENRARFESEVVFLKQKSQQLEFQVQDLASQLDAERASRAETDAAWGAQLGAREQELAALAAEVEKYRTLEGSLADRLKWAIKGK
ncbi:MAG: trichohyalin [Elusimicrobia bacterium]|nr:MAG: trichohyalin [Elusimicrobiota bacterium]KAF0156184.1 MAG: trichohyalin [Elusimicrobiota bacterium]